MIDQARLYTARRDYQSFTQSLDTDLRRALREARPNRPNGLFSLAGFVRAVRVRVVGLRRPAYK